MENTTLIIDKDIAKLCTKLVCTTYWDEHRLHITREGRVPDTNQKIYFVKEQGYNGELLSNILVFSI